MTLKIVKRRGKLPVADKLAASPARREERCKRPVCELSSGQQSFTGVRHINSTGRAWTRLAKVWILR